MTASLLARLRTALHEKYEVECELGAGGMGVVFLARDRVLDRPVAIKVLRPEQATAQAAERFLREARILANLNHPNVVPVHSADEADGLFYYVMDYVDGATLAERLRRGPLDPATAVELVCDVLEALEAAHSRDIVHRDVKPGNIFLVGSRAILADFGIAKPTDDEGTALTATGQVVGTPAYMPPEQIDGVVTPRTDLYAVGMVLYEALSGHRWTITRSPEDVLVAGVPRRLARILGRALAWSPDDRWESARAFREALTGRRSASRTLGMVGGAAAATALAVLVWLLWDLFWDGGSTTEDASYELAVLPFEAVGEVTLSPEELARLVHHKLSQYGNLRLVPTRVSFPWWDRVGDPSRASQGVGARFIVSARLVPSQAGLDVLLELYEGAKPVAGHHRVHFARDASLQEVSDSLTVRLARVVLEGDLPAGSEWTVDPEALRNFVLAESDFERGAWVPAVRYYRAAVTADSDFALAWWRLANAWRWIGQPEPLEKDFAKLLLEHGDQLIPADSALIVAQLSQAGRERLSRYRDAYLRYPQNDFVAYLYGEELFNRGPLWGLSLDSAVAVLEVAVKLNPYWTSTHVHLIWAHIRLGRRDDARRWLDGLPRIAAGPEHGWLYTPQLLEQAYGERFGPESKATEGRERLLEHATYGAAEWLVTLARVAGGFDVPAAQVAFGREGVRRAVHPSVCGGGHLAAGLGLLGLGRVEASIAQMDSAAECFGTSEANLQAAEWVVVLAALKLGEPEGERLVRAGATLLEIAANDSSPRHRERARWALALDARARGAVAALPDGVSLPDTALLATFLTAIAHADAGRLQDALTTSAALLDRQALTVQLRGSTPARPALDGPFARSVLHLLRGEWHERLGDRDAADREWLWYEAADVVGLPVTDPLQPGEVDWALGTYGRLRRGLNDLARDEVESACRHLVRVVALWSSSGADAPAPLLEKARAARAEACP